MIQLDRNLDVPLHAQLSSRLRYLIVSGHFGKGELLPSTRHLARQLGISFHTVRRAYADLVEEHYLEPRHGAGYAVVDFQVPSKSTRMERGASIVSDALQQLVGLGLDEGEIDYLIQEQASILETEQLPFKIVLVGPFQEWTEQCAQQIEDAIQHEITPVDTSQVEQHADADYMLVPFRMLRTVMGLAPNADVLGVQSELSDHALASASRLLERETLGLVTRNTDAIGPLTAEIREQTRFSGQILAVSIEHETTHVEPVLQQSDMVLYTPGSWKMLKSAASKIKRSAELSFTVSPSSIDRLRELIPA